VRPGDTVSARINVADTKPSRKPDRGVVTFHIDIVNQHQEVAQTGTAKILMKRRSAV
jgi:acyl dehydratase